MVKTMPARSGPESVPTSWAAIPTQSPLAGRCNVTVRSALRNVNFWMSSRWLIPFPLSAASMTRSRGEGMRPSRRGILVRIHPITSPTPNAPRPNRSSIAFA